MIRRRALFLDKDGVINVDHGYVCTPERTIFLDGIFDLCRAATRCGYLNVVITNQAGIARGYYTEQDFLAYMDWMRGEFVRNGAQIDAVYFCPHHPVHGLGPYLSDCDCRKPKPGMILAAQRKLDLDLAASVLLGDNNSDILAGRSAGIGTCIEIQSEPEGESAAIALDRAALRRALEIMASGHQAC